ncbi:uncharacterized protein Z518_07335 [Rhinocladiella mackenziei CBS 650.93]|uniref:Vps72/YL1 C-terminal domain-containing protein n=1 Tax=Rhinocladiella mackenziei CBS 650.93 TaxID=1442369 RepID=A0A0D2FNV6_9EURO|nr:uncharacterized protein Z518_07335 [Rhinocladiella mackenziei CBS 650.93]KIX03782.1 hypothetical protein Z518_07335 [Rhinocladiella mackenziei CBS 650.93]
MTDYDPTDDTSQLSGIDTGEDESDEDPVETLVAGRERRKTAGNRYDRGMVLEEAAADEDPDEVTLLFADNEEEEDEEFKSSDEDEDADMSSSDDDDQGPNAPVDDLEGEKELQKQVREERAKKRKAGLALTSTAGLRKKLKTGPTRPAAASPQPKPSKKKERVTWIHDQDSGRSSLRKQTIAHRAETIARLKESEAQSKKLKALKEQRERERAKDAPKELTQADRLAEAARVERQNARSLNRWEAMEKKKQEEQAAKLAALKNRKLEGPVVSWWSAKATWVGSKLIKIGTKDAGDVMEGGAETKRRGRKSKAFQEQMPAVKSVDLPSSSTEQTNGTCSLPPPASTLDQSKEPILDKKPDVTAVPEESQQPQVPLAPALEPEDSFLKGIHEHITIQGNNNEPDKDRTSPSPNPNTQKDNEKSLASQPASSGNPDNTVQEAQTNPSPQISVESVKNGTIKTETPDPDQSQAPIIVELASEPTPAPEPVVEYSTRNLVILEKFDELSGESRQEYGLFYNNRKTAKPVKHSQELCPITTLPVRYRDKSTGIGYANVTAYKKLQELKEHRFAWSSMLGCYVGRIGGVVARGVPEGFV